MRFRRPQIIPVLFIIGSTLLLGGLGVWQVQRLQWKQELLSEIAAAQAQPTLTELPADITGLEYRNVKLIGAFLNGKKLREAGGVQDEGPGFFFLTPFQLPDGRMIMVNRGFAPQGKEGSPKGVQTVTGILRDPRPQRYFSPPNDFDKNLWFYEDLAAMAHATNANLLPLIVEATGKRERGVYPIANEGKIIVRNDHLGYAITWFSIAILGIIMFVFYHRIPEDRPPKQMIGHD